MKNVLLWDPRFPRNAPLRAVVSDAVAAAIAADGAGVVLSEIVGGRALIGGDVTSAIALGPVIASFTSGAAPGSLIAAIVGLASGETIASVAPNDGRIGISGSSLVVGSAIAMDGVIAATVTTSTGRVLVIIVTVLAPPNAIPNGQGGYVLNNSGGYVLSS